MREKQSALKIIAAASGLGAPDNRCAKGPEAVLSIIQKHPELLLSWHQTVTPSNVDDLASLVPFFTQLANVTESLLKKESRVAVLSGDHSCAIGTWRGVRRAMKGPLGLIWIDAHMDAHTPATSPSGYWHGMPVATLLGQAENSFFSHEGAAVAPHNLCLLGVRSYEPEEQQLLQTLGVRVFAMDEIKRVGFAAAMAEAVAIASDGTQGYGISIDLDGIDPADAPGVGSPVVGGISATDLLQALQLLQSDPCFRALEVAEFNPVIDVEQRTLHLVVQILKIVSGAEDESNH